MCDPATIAATMAVVGTVSTMHQQRQQAKFQRGVAEHQQRVNEFNARVAENEAQEIRNQGVEQENLQRRRTAELISKQRSQIAGAGLDLGFGSALQLQEDAQTLGEADALRIRSNFDRRVTSAQQRADLIRAGGDLAATQSEFQASANRASQFSTLLGGTSQFLSSGVADSWFSPDSAAVTASNTSSVGII